MNEDLKSLIEECYIAEQKYKEIKYNLSIVQAEANSFISKLGSTHDRSLANQVFQNIKSLEEELSEAKLEFRKMEAIVTDFKKQLSHASSLSQSDLGSNDDHRIVEANLKELIIHFNFLHGKYSRLEKEAKKSEKIVRAFERSGVGGVSLGAAIEKAIIDRRNASEVYQSLLDLKQILNEPSVAELVRNRTILRDLNFAKSTISKLTNSKLTKTEPQIQASSYQSLSFRALRSTRYRLANLTVPTSQVQISRIQALSCQASSSQEFLLEDDKSSDLQSLLSKILMEMETQIDKDRKLNKNTDVINSLYQDIKSCVIDFKQNEDYDELRNNLIICIDNGINNLNTIDYKIYNTYVYCLNIIIDICNLFINLMSNANPYPKMAFFKPPFTYKLEDIKKKLEPDDVENLENEENLIIS